MKKVIVNKNGTVQIEINKFNFIVYVKNINFEGFALKYKVGEQWFFQHLMLGCRGGAKNYFNEAKTLYRHIKKEKLTSQTFKRLAV